MPTQVIEVGSGSYLCHTDVMKCNVVYYEIQCKNKRKKREKKKGIIEYDKSTVISDVDTAKCNNRTVKFETKKGYH